MSQEEETSQAEGVSADGPTAESQSAEGPSRIGVFLNQPLTKVQAMVGICAGLITITGSVLSVVGLTHRGPTQGEILAIIQDGSVRKPVAEATVEILTPDDALVTTMTAAADGRVIRLVKEGHYRIKVTHPHFSTVMRHVEVHSGERSELRVALTPRPAAHVPVVAPAAPPTSHVPISKSVPVSKPTSIAKPSPTMAASEPVKKPVEAVIVAPPDTHRESP